MFFTSEEEATAFYRKCRAGNMQAARGCRKTLIDPNGFWHYSPDDPRVKKAASFWVDRARRAHRILMGREPIIRNFLVSTERTQAFGDLYATNRNEA